MKSAFSTFGAVVEVEFVFEAEVFEVDAVLDVVEFVFAEAFPFPDSFESELHPRPTAKTNDIDAKDKTRLSRFINVLLMNLIY